ncbi:hypothetical protein lerEdw1_001010 [Lerista edwardsae]|nr:hypothetical protein lerEdw1_001010 [Lerista edwardsae]
MRFLALAPALVSLMLLLISAGSSQISADGSSNGFRWVLQELKRQRGRPGADREKLQVIRQKRAARSLNPQDAQVEVKNCTACTDTECGCKAGHYKNCNDRKNPCEDFSCSDCTSCVAENRMTVKNCSENEDAECGDCLPGYNLSANDECLLQPLTTQNPKIELCKNLQSCKRDAPDSGEGYARLLYPLLISLICLLLLGGLVFYCKRRRRAKKPPTAGSLLSLPQPGLPMLRTSLSHGSPLQGRQLYTIIDVVPVRRWKEFVRSLGLRDSEIEVVELEHRQLREQQYEMLKCWRQKQGATVDVLFAALEDMELGGCAQELQQLLLPNNSQPSS